LNCLRRHHAQAIELLRQLTPSQGARLSQLQVTKGAAQNTEAKQHLLSTFNGFHHTLYQGFTFYQGLDLLQQYITLVLPGAIARQVQLPVKLGDSEVVPESFEMLCELRELRASLLAGRLGSAKGANRLKRPRHRSMGFAPRMATP